ncbi:dolichyl-P-Man:Man(7)GlcNAc(2)-PP-dolichol alpha-1,6-mannosyltransferase [Kluyveromyces lactis]|uniref:Mannosyltransferase n=1 Tax=Kluyveromyces lactis (strain ATCC 8585 / CBS 2359 / DSM 70799 / NBRC 1267 / NRRL Y-1140 / WM37) TaxID=284590 RepID=Q6CU06_KLULA|nr:uncharacterized protein KLLA0_C08591g [Kluyveromyces lactis]CAH01434.1 KLLA0C08591p [Kluyveromyces lactis]|eukprot:XP_452583.1 uncharacterized protein KLLA0_C08591g [Kluyveromyces lactis]
MDGIFDLTTVLTCAVSLHLWYSPYTKVEESFTLQAVHDILTYGVFDVSNYDHVTFAGAVPRSFVGPLILSALTYPFNLTISKDPFRTQMLVRFLIGLTNTVALNRFIVAAKKALTKDQEQKSGKEETTSTTKYTISASDLTNWFGLFTATQFHLMFYSSRPLPNFVMALPLSLLGLSWALEENYRWSIILLSFTAIVFRLEIAVLAVGVALGAFFYEKISLTSIVRTGFIGAGAGIFLSIQVDSYFWNRLTVPEIEAFIFNVVHGESSKWGTQPFFAYLTGYLPMMFIPPTALLLNHLGFKIGPNSFRVVGIAAYFHVLVMSLQPHKEWRFIIYSNPPITLLGATAAAYLFKNIDNKSVTGVAVRFVLLLTPLLSLFISIAFSYISTMNYPGGVALENFNEIIKSQNITDAVVHLDVPVCMTGATLFGQLDDSWNITYDKTEDGTLSSKWPSFNYLITPIDNSSLIPTEDGNRWELISKSQGFGGINTEYLVKTFTEQYANGLDLYVTWERSRDFTFIKEIFDNALAMKDVFYTYQKVPIL